jgi:hypothetical protein
MKKNFLTLMFTFFACILFGQKVSVSYRDLINIGDSLLQAKDYDKAAQAYSSAFRSLGWKGTERDRYKAAEAWALANVPDSAIYCLEKIAFNLYYDNYTEIIYEDDFNSLHKDKRWPLLVKQIQRNKLPDNWSRNETKPLSYRIYMEDSAGQNYGRAATIKSITDKKSGVGNLMQSFAAGKYKGKRIRMTGFMKSDRVDDWAGFWLRIDQAKVERHLAFDNMHDGKKNRSVTGTTGWKKYDIVLDVPEDATNIVFGALLAGTGQIWFEKLNFEIVDKTVPTTGRSADEPNLDFDK